ncbi:MAG: YlxR family protein [Actinomycetota bacterium]
MPTALARRRREPIRTCIGCRATRPQSELRRVVRTGGRLVIDRTAPGRGAWLCAADLVSCLDLATTRRRWAPAFRTPIAAGAVADLRSRVVGDAPGTIDHPPSTTECHGAAQPDGGWVQRR